MCVECETRLDVWGISVPSVILRRHPYREGYGCRRSITAIIKQAALIDHVSSLHSHNMTISRFNINVPLISRLSNLRPRFGFCQFLMPCVFQSTSLLLALQPAFLLHRQVQSRSGHPPSQTPFCGKTSPISMSPASEMFFTTHPQRSLTRQAPQC